MAGKRKAPPSKTGKATARVKERGARRVKDGTPVKKAKPSFQVVWRTAWIDAKGRRAKTPEGPPPAGYRQIAWQAFRDPKGRWTKVTREQLDAVEIQYEVRYRPTKGRKGKRNEWQNEDTITRDDPYLWLQKMDVARFSRRGDKGRWALSSMLDKDQDLRNQKSLEKYRRLQWSEVPPEQKIQVHLHGATLAEALGRFVFPVNYGETWAIAGKVDVTFRTEFGEVDEEDEDGETKTATLYFQTAEDWYKRMLRDAAGNVVRDENGRPKYDPNSGVYGGDLQSSWRNRVRDEISKELSTRRIRFSNAEKLRALYDSGALGKRKKAGYWDYKKADRDPKTGKAVKGTAGRFWVPSQEYTDKKEADMLYSDMMSRHQATNCDLTLWIERVKVPE